MIGSSPLLMLALALGGVQAPPATPPQTAPAQSAAAQAAAPQTAAPQSAAQPTPPVTVPADNPLASKSYEEAFLRYIASARQMQVPANIWMTDLMLDPNARRTGDLLTIRVVENVNAIGSAESNVGKASGASVSVPAPTLPVDLGLPSQLFKWGPIAAETKFNGTGATARTTALTAVVTARVTEVLPNGNLVVEAVREVEINGDRNLIVVTGIVRPADIQPGNVILSPQIGQFRIQSHSKGLIKDSLSPGWLIRALNKIF